MAPILPQYEELDEFMEIAHKLIERYPDVFSGIDAARIGCVSITNKERDEKKPRFDIKTAVPPISMYTTKEYVIVVYLNDWSAMAEKHKALLVADAIRSISPEGQGKKVPFDMKDHSLMLRTFGVDYLENPTVPDLLRDNISWRN